MSNFDNATPIVNLPYLTINGGVLSNHPTTPNTLLNISACICRDSTNTFDLNLGNFNGQNNTGTANSVTTINAAVRGLNGIDTGTFAANTLYNVYVVADTVSGLATGAMISLAEPSTGPLLPFGYNTYRLIGYVPTNTTAIFEEFFQSGDRSQRKFQYGQAAVTSVTAGTATTFTDFSLTNIVPKVDNLVVTFELDFNATSANQIVSLNAPYQNYDAMYYRSAVAGATAHLMAYPVITTQLYLGNPSARYKVSAGASVVITVKSFEYSI